MNKLMSRDGKLFGKISIIDLAIVGLVLLVFLGITLRQMRTEQDVELVQDTPIHYIVEISNVRHWWTGYNVRPGDQVFSSNTQVGTVTAITYEPYITTALTAHGVLQAEVPDRYIVRIHVEARATVDDGRVLVSHSIPMGAGNAMVPFSTRYASFSGRILELDYEQ